jgi:hypothetical protein
MLGAGRLALNTFCGRKGRFWPACVSVAAQNPAGMVSVTGDSDWERCA